MSESTEVIQQYNISALLLEFDNISAEGKEWIDSDELDYILKNKILKRFRIK